MLNFAIDISDTLAEFNIRKADIDSLADYVLDRTVDEFMTQWEKLIDSGLNSTRDEYKRSIYTDRPDSRTAIVGMNSRDSKLALMIETGATVFDMKSGFENSSKKHPKKDGGWYLTIPFRHGSSEAIMQMMVSGMEVSVIDLMKQGETIGVQQLPEGENEPKTHQISLQTGPIITYKHKAPIYAGMSHKNMSSTLSEKRGGYFTFRRVSDKSDEQAWIHPGFGARNFMDKALQSSKLAEAVDNAVQDWLDVKFG